MLSVLHVVRCLWWAFAVARKVLAHKALVFVVTGMVALLPRLNSIWFVTLVGVYVVFSVFVVQAAVVF